MKNDSVNTVVLAHPHILIREGISRILQEGGFDVIGQTEDLADLYKLASRDKPDIVLLDWEISEKQVNAVKGLSEAFPNVKIVVLTRPDTSLNFLQALGAGAGGYLSVNLNPSDFVQSLRMLARGSLIVAKENVEGSEVDLTLEKSFVPNEQLSDREIEVLKLVGIGKTNREIADELILSQHTIKVHIRSILTKLNLRNRQQAASYATQTGLVGNFQNEENP
jgi:DNA-binding NarL/FixJ family response regulator